MPTVLPESVNTTRSNSLLLRRSREFVWRLSNIANEMRKCEPQIQTFLKLLGPVAMRASSCLWNDLYSKLSIRTSPEPIVDRATLTRLPRRSLTEGAIEECWSCGVAIQRLAKLKSKLRSDRINFRPHSLIYWWAIAQSSNWKTWTWQSCQTIAPIAVSHTPDSGQT